jgi:hypothetical protein
MPTVPQDPTRRQSQTRCNTCFSRRHLRPPIEAFYQYVVSVSHTSGVFFSHARRDAWEFNVSKNSITDWIDKLETDGWLQRLDRGPRLKRSKNSGMYASIRYRVLTHDEWVAAHPGRCRFPQTESAFDEPVPKTGTGDSAPVPISDATCPSLGIPPVPKTGTKVCSKTEIMQDRDKEAPPPQPVAKNAPFVLPEWIPEAAWNDYLDMRRRIRKPATRAAMQLAVDRLEKLADEGHPPRVVLEHSILNNYQGLFAPRKEKLTGDLLTLSNMRAVGLLPDKRRAAIESTERASQRFRERFGATNRIDPDEITRLNLENAGFKAIDSPDQDPITVDLGEDGVFDQKEP